MGQVIVATAVSVDGYAEGSGGDISVMPLDESFNEHNAEQIAGAAQVLYGATTYRQMVSYWPQVPDNPDASAAEQRIATKMAEGLPVIVVSDSMTSDDTDPWREQTTIVRRGDAHRAVSQLREAEGDTVIFGSRTVWSDLLAHGLVDQLHLMVGPKIVAGDTPVFDGVPTTGLRLMGVTQFDGSPAVVLRYRVEHD
ncbi:dihydrofolate reductase family protein [Nocardioides sp.]|uniref:dihydrofolate reductase family protein n=1 Tax=Nocardioides sp. TaxID=35761 RepID=UPI002722A60A|nr:dihydrofolate reductase family protein [Nocardioides sp.]MDO9455982.1 dihydrofolate reductase family protein [Nocardioides sp.]